MKSFKTEITLRDKKTTVRITPRLTGYLAEGPDGVVQMEDLLPEDRERIEFDINDLRKSESSADNEEPQTGAMSPKGTKQMERATLNTLLEKLGVTDPARLETERAKKKLGTRLGSKGIPEGVALSDDEKDIIREVGFGWLPQVGGSGKPADALAMASGAPQAGEKPEKGSKPAPKGTKPAKGKPTPAAKGKPANKAAAKANGTPAEKKPRERTGGAAIFVKAFPNKQVVVVKDDLIKEVAAAGVSEASALAYIVWAKREKAGPPNKTLNPFPFFLAERLNKDGIKVLQRAGEPV
jgi:hypothetical protein